MLTMRTRSNTLFIHSVTFHTIKGNNWSQLAHLPVLWGSRVLLLGIRRQHLVQIQLNWRTHSCFSIWSLRCTKFRCSHTLLIALGSMKQPTLRVDYFRYFLSAPPHGSHWELLVVSPPESCQWTLRRPSWAGWGRCWESWRPFLYHASGAPPCASAAGVMDRALSQSQEGEKQSINHHLLAFLLSSASTPCLRTLSAPLFLKYLSIALYQNGKCFNVFTIIL